jgi:hypothetical protein
VGMFWPNFYKARKIIKFISPRIPQYPQARTASLARAAIPASLFRSPFYSDNRETPSLILLQVKSQICAASPARLGVKIG